MTNPQAILIAVALTLSHLAAWYFGMWCIWTSMHYQLRKAHRRMGLNEEAVERHVKALRNGDRLPVWTTAERGAE